VTSLPETAYGHIEIEDERVVVADTMGRTEEAVREYFKDAPVMVQIARCESHFRHDLSDGSVLRGKVDNDDLGVMQINTRYHGSRAAKLGLDLHDLDDNMAFARLLYEEQGTRPWNASAPCWNRSLALK
jgi:hypothetical protein